jgi:hypothetical protein
VALATRLIGSTVVFQGTSSLVDIDVMTPYILGVAVWVEIKRDKRTLCARSLHCNGRKVAPCGCTATVGQLAPGGWATNLPGLFL